MENSFQSELSLDYMRPGVLHHSFGGIDLDDVPRRIAACAGYVGISPPAQAADAKPKN